MDMIEAQRYDQGMQFLERLRLSELRRQLVSEVSGSVLEIGTGTGANIGRYQNAVQVFAIDLRENYLQLATQKASETQPAMAFSAASANAQFLPFASSQFDAVVGSLVFCSIAEPRAALSEICRVLKPGGRLHLLEHVRGQTFLTRALTDVFHPLWFAMQGECHLNRETALTVASAGFTLQQTTVHGGGLLQMIKATAPAPCTS
jgi:ubiquinone/menaquinone biosynthesis C-methylase UbiE